MASDTTHQLSIVLFGITGSLSKNKIIPSLWFLYRRGLLPESWQVIGIGRRLLKNSELIILISTAVGDEWNTAEPSEQASFVNQFMYISGDLRQRAIYLKLRRLLSHDSDTNILLYLSTFPHLYDVIIAHWRQSFHERKAVGTWFRVMIEKPFGLDLNSSVELNQHLHSIAPESSVYRVDHYLAKETVQNILAFRFANGVFEHLWKSQFIDHIQVTYAETQGVEGREEFFGSVGIVRDVVQNHVLQLLSVLMMEEPSALEARAIQRQRVALLSSMVVPSPKEVGRDCALAQYEGAHLAATVPTAVALRLEVENERWKNLPIFIRAGKGFPTAVIEAQIVFKEPLNTMFARKGQAQNSNVLTIRIQPNEGIALVLYLKQPGLRFALEKVPMSFCYRSAFASQSLIEAYSKVLFDVINGDTSLFLDAAGSDACWRIVQPLLEASTDSQGLASYEKGSWGPASFDTLLSVLHKAWIEPDLSICSI